MLSKFLIEPLSTNCYSHNQFGAKGIVLFRVHKTDVSSDVALQYTRQPWFRNTNTLPLAIRLLTRHVISIYLNI